MSEEKRNWKKESIEKAITKILVAKKREYIDIDASEATPNNISSICKWAKEMGHQAKPVEGGKVRIFAK